MDSYMTVKGQIVIPSKIRRKFGIKEGTRVQVEVDEQTHRIILTPVTRDYIQNLRGKYKAKNLLTALAAEKKREREL
jgi:AbrB family looped-hinge helix DNA binding protein